jgi:hypothetical protein
MATPRQQRELLNTGAFVSHLNNALRHLNRRWGTTVVVDAASAARAHEASKAELEILLDSKNDDELFQGYDTFLDILVENLIKEHAFNHLLASSNRTNRLATICDLIQKYAHILVPIVLLDDWLRSIVFALIHRAIPSFFEEPNVEAVRDLCLVIQANSDEARHWRRIVGYPPLESGAD